LGKWHNNCSDPLEIWMIYQCKSAKDPTQNLVLLIQKGEQSWFSTTHTYIYTYSIYMHRHVRMISYDIVYDVYVHDNTNVHMYIHICIMCVYIYIHIKKDICVYI
jgi:hypothetical protein